MLFRKLALCGALGALAGVNSGCTLDAEETFDPAEALALLQLPCADALDSIYEAPLSTPAGAEHGDIVACAYDRGVSSKEMVEHFAHYAIPQPSLSSTGAHKLRISYYTERAPGELVLATAAIYLPKVRRATPSPVVVFGHGSVGVADFCAPSQEDPRGFEKSWKMTAYTFAGDGWLVVQPDYTGLGADGPSAWMYSVDEAHSMLDATRAVRALFAPEQISDRNALVGHSNGGHAVFSAQSQVGAYGAAGEVSVVVGYAPFWVSNAAWGALLSPAGVALMTPTFMSMTMQYFYGHLAVYEGPEHALDAFQASKADAVGALLEGACWQDITNETSGPPSIGAELGTDVFTTDYTDLVGNCGLSDQCDSELATTWRERWVADRPAPQTDIPIVHYTGAKDDFFPPGYQQCGIDRLEAQGAELTVCVDPEGDHSTLVVNSADWMRAYLAHRLLDEPAPAPCVGAEVYDEPPECALPITNSLEPTEP